jgi:hypothetical protein
MAEPEQRSSVTRVRVGRGTSITQVYEDSAASTAPRRSAVAETDGTQEAPLNRNREAGAPDLHPPPIQTFDLDGQAVQLVSS